MRVRLKGLNCVRKGLANGSVVTYYYAWKGGPRLQGALGTPKFMASYNAAVATRAIKPSGMLQSILDEYESFSDFQALAERSPRITRSTCARSPKNLVIFPFQLSPIEGHAGSSSHRVTGSH